MSKVMNRVQNTRGIFQETQEMGGGVFYSLRKVIEVRWNVYWVSSRKINKCTDKGGVQTLVEPSPQETRSENRTTELVIDCRSSMSQLQTTYMYFLFTVSRPFSFPLIVTKVACSFCNDIFECEFHRFRGMLGKQNNKRQKNPSTGVRIKLILMLSGVFQQFKQNYETTP